MESKNKTKQKEMVLKNLGKDRNKDADVENGLEGTGRGKCKVRRSEKWHGHIYTTKCKIDS